MIRGQKDDYFKIDNGQLLYNESEIIEINNIKAVYVDTIGNSTKQDDHNFYIVRLKTIDDKVYNLSRSSEQFLAGDTLRSVFKGICQYGDFGQYGGSILNLRLIDRATMGISDTMVVNAVFKDGEAITVINTPFLAVGRRCYEKLKKDVRQYKNNPANII